MKYIKLSLFSILIFFTAHSYTITLDQSIIDQKACEIEKKLKQDRYIMYGLTTMTVAYGLYLWMPLLTNLVLSKTASVEKPQEKDTSTKEEQKSVETRPLSLIFKESLQSFAYGTRDFFYDIFCTKESWKSFIQFTIISSGTNIIAQISEQFIHPHTLRWYIHAHAPYHLTIKMMKDKIKDLHNTEIDQEQQCVSNKMLPLLCNRLVRQATLICAYLTYKIKYLDDAEKIIGERTKMSMLKVHHKWLNDIETELHSSERDLVVIVNLLEKYEEALNAQVNHFAFIEGETKRERMAIKKQMKQRLNE